LHPWLTTIFLLGKNYLAPMIAMLHGDCSEGNTKGKNEAKRQAKG
jgi:hypothetical protein